MRMFILSVSKLFVLWMIKLVNVEVMVALKELQRIAVKCKLRMYFFLFFSNLIDNILITIILLRELNILL